MSYFKAKKHQIRFRLGLYPRPSWGSLQHFPIPSSWISLDIILLRGGGHGRKRTGERMGRMREGKRKAREGENSSLCVPMERDRRQWSSGFPPVKKSLFPLTQYQNVTDRQTDGRTSLL